MTLPSLGFPTGRATLGPRARERRDLSPSLAWTGVSTPGMIAAAGLAGSAAAAQAARAAPAVCRAQAA